MADFCYLEYGYPRSEFDQVHLVLKSIGFDIRSTSADQSARFYSQNNAVILLREQENIPAPQLIGVGMLSNDQEIHNLTDSHDEVIDAPVLMAGNFRITLLTKHNHLERWRELGFKMAANPVTEGYKIQEFTSLVVSGLPETVEVWKRLGFKFTRDGNWTTTAVSPNRRFELLISADIINPIVVAETSGIFDTVAALALNGHTGIKTHNHVTPSQLDYRIKAYQCAYFGATNSYSVEKFYPNLALGHHLLLRERVKYLHTYESNLEAHLASYATTKLNR
jgi:hypothetical protein